MPPCPGMAGASGYQFAPGGYCQERCLSLGYPDQSEEPLDSAPDAGSAHLRSTAWSGGRCSSTRSYVCKRGAQLRPLFPMHEGSLPCCMGGRRWMRQVCHWNGMLQARHRSSATACAAGLAGSGVRRTHSFQYGNLWTLATAIHRRSTLRSWIRTSGHSHSPPLG